MGVRYSGESRGQCKGVVRLGKLGSTVFDLAKVARKVVCASRALKKKDHASPQQKKGTENTKLSLWFTNDL